MPTPPFPTQDNSKRMARPHRPHSIRLNDTLWRNRLLHLRWLHRRYRQLLLLLLWRMIHCFMNRFECERLHDVFIFIVSDYNLVQTIRLHLSSNALYIIPIYLQTSRYAATTIYNYIRPFKLTIHNLPHRSSNESCYILVAASLNYSGRSLYRNNKATMSIGIRHRR